MSEELLFNDPEYYKDFDVVTNWNSFFSEILNNRNGKVWGKIFNVAIPSFYNSSARQLKFELEFSECYFKENVILDTYFGADVTFRNCLFDGSVSVYHNTTFKENFDLDNVFIRRSIIIHSGTFNKCRWKVNDCRIDILSGHFENLEISQRTNEIPIKAILIRMLDLSGAIYITSHFPFNKIKIDTLYIGNAMSKATIAVQNALINYIQIDHYRNNSLLRFSDVAAFGENSQIEIKNSNLDKAEFFAVDFKSFSKILIDNSNLVDSTFVNANWKYDIKSSDSSPKQHRETYRQLKYALSKQGDIINEQKFHVQEMLAYDKSIGWGDQFWNKLIIKLSYYTSDFGQSVSRPLASILLINMILFIIFADSGYYNNATYKYLHFSDRATWDGAFEGTKQFLIFLNPLKKLEPDTMNVGQLLIDIISRIWSSYMLYNIIRATRRFIK